MPANTNLSISIITVCRDRLNHIQKTLPENIFNNKDYRDLEFVLLDYNSTDGLDRWIADAMQTFIDRGRLRYFRAGGYRFFNRSHSRNMAFRLAGNDIVCNIDADNFTGKDFSFLIERHFRRYPKGFLSTGIGPDLPIVPDALGRIVCRKSDFEHIRGFDEKMTGYGYEDLDLTDRLNRSGSKQYSFPEEFNMSVIQHHDSERIRNEPASAGIENVYIKYVSPFHSEVIYLFRNTTFRSGNLLDRGKGFGNPEIEERSWLKGRWSRSGSVVLLDYDSGEKIQLSQTGEGDLTDPGKHVYFLIKDDKFRQKLKMNYSIIANHQQYLNNLSDNSTHVNPRGFGQGQVMLNFNRVITLD